MSNIFKSLNKKIEQFNQIKNNIPIDVLKKFQRAFDIEYANDSTTIEGNTLSLAETKLLLEDKISIGGKDLREIHEVVNHDAAFKYVRRCIDEDKSLNESIVKDIHAMLTNNIMLGGVYREVNVRIVGSRHFPPEPIKMYHKLQNFYADLIWKSEQLHPIELAAWTHAEFVNIHPFPDGNGRTSRLIMNYQLMKHGLLPVSIKNENKIKYFEALELYHTTQNLVPFVDMVATAQEEQLDLYLNIII